MKTLNYLSLVIVILMMNIMHAELKTWGMPSDSETEEAPSEQLPTEEAPSEETPSEETPSEETPSEETPSEETPSEEAEMPSAGEDSEGQPIEFKEEYVFSMNLGSALPFGTNLKDNFTSGMNIQADIKTPFSFSGFNLFGNLGMFTLTGEGEHSDKYGDYSVTSFGASIAKDFSKLNLNLGTGLALASGTTLYNPWDDYSMTTLYISGGLSYKLPLSGLLEKVAGGKMKDLQLALNAGGMIIFGGPDPNGSSDMLNFGLGIKYPFFF